MPKLFSGNLAQLTDADIGYQGVISRLDPMMLKPGFVSRAINRRFDQGKIRNRWGVARPIWGGKWIRGTRVVDVEEGKATSDGVSGPSIPTITQIVCDPTITNPGPPQSKGIWVFPSGTIVLNDSGSTVETSKKALAGFNGAYNVSYHLSTDPFLFTDKPATDTEPAVTHSTICGILSYRDANSGSESLLVAVDEARTGAGQDGGQGKVYILRPGQSHLTILSNGVETINMHGHDFAGPVRMIRTAGAVVMLRPGPLRYYFIGTDIEKGLNDYVRLHVLPDFETGTKVRIVRLPDDKGDLAPAFGPIVDDAHYFVRVSGQDISFHPSRDAAETATSIPIVLAPTPATARYYLLVAESVNWWSQPVSTAKVSTTEEEIANDGTALILQSSEAFPNALDAGFDRVPNVLTVLKVVDKDKLVFSSTGPGVKDENAEPNTLIVPNHRLVPGDRVDIGGAKYYINPVDDQRLKLYDGDTGEDPSLAGDDTNLVIDSTNHPAAGDVIKYLGKPIHKAGASGAPIPAGREGCYFGNRLIIVYGFDQIAVSDVLDPLHYLPLIDEFKLNTGTNDPIVAIYPFNQTTLLVFKQRSILAIENIYGDMSNVQLVEMTREFGCLAPRTIVSTGSDVVFLSQRGVCSIKQTEFGIQQSVVLPLSDPIQDDIENISQVHVSAACAAYWDNKYILSVASEKNSKAKIFTNDMTLVYNFLTSSWDGTWQGGYLRPAEYERFDVNGTLRLIWSDASGYIHYFSPDAVVDPDGEIYTEVRFRAFTCSVMQHKQWTDVRFSLGTFNPKMTLQTFFDGVEESLPLLDDWTRDRQLYMRFGLAPYKLDNSNDDFFAPYREDYSLKPGFALKLGGVKLKLHQLFNYRAPVRGTGAFIQPVLITSQGSVEVYSAQMFAVASRDAGTLDS